MNTRAYDLVVILRGLLGMFPGATAIGFHGFEAWALVLITMSSDEGVIALGETLGLACDVTRAEGFWWRWASAEDQRGTFRIVVTGPHHWGPPPRDDAEGAS